MWSLQDFPRRTTLPELRAVPVTELPGVGPRIAAALKDLAIVSIADLVSHYPSRHEDLSNVKKISNLRVGEFGTAERSQICSRERERVCGWYQPHSRLCGRAFVYRLDTAPD